MTHLVAGELKFRYTERLIIDGVSLDLHSGEVLVLLGANGAGKTTLLRLISRQIKLESGSVSLNECDVSNLSRRKLAQQIALMPQRTGRWIGSASGWLQHATASSMPSSCRFCGTVRLHSLATSSASSRASHPKP